ncbi:MAG TPA: lactate utilization protein C [Balneolaceae bacterium]|nr:lactate utilization protein C [Balneolaceae bacterium]
MSDAKNEILKRIRRGLQDVPEEETPEKYPVQREYRQKSDLGQQELVQLFAERVGEYKAVVSKIEQASLAEKIAESCRSQGVKQLVVPPEFPKKWLPGEPDLLDDGSKRLTKSELDASDGVISTCRLAVAETGTIVLDGGAGQGRRALSLVPDYHLCIIEANQIVGSVPEAFSQLAETVRKSGPPVTFISGPSATSDIELNRVEGVHGPRRLEIIIAI